MHRFLGKTRLHIAWLITILYTFLFSGCLLWASAVREYTDGYFFYYFLCDVIFSLFLIWPFFFCLLFHPLIAYLLIPPLFLTGAIASYFVQNLQVSINELVIPVLFETTPDEAKAFLTGGLVLWLLFALLVSLPPLYLIRRSQTTANDTKILLMGVILSAGLVYSGDTYGANIMPYNYVYATTKYLINRFHLTSNVKYDVSQPKATLTTPANDALTVVMVIGESARGDHFSLNGYSRKTSPLLETVPRLVNFPQVTSCEVLTRYSVPCMLTRATSKDPHFASKETSFITIFRKLGFRTVWINGQSSDVNFFMDKGITDISMKSDLYLSGRTIKWDGNLLPTIQKTLQENPKKLLLIIHTRGSHWRYKSRYPESFRSWSPICQESTYLTSYINEMKACSREELVNDYDNSILYTDYFLHSVIGMLKDRNSLFLYSSDHGESLGENGHYLHGQYKDRNIKEQRSVPMLWWASESYIAQNKARYEALKSNTNHAVSHDNIFHSILDCSSIETEVVDKKLSLCR